MRADLHMHSTASDGTLSPSVLMETAFGCGIEAAALTDHDSISGVKSAAEAASRLGMRFLNGIEISCQTASREVHILGYGFSSSDTALQEFCGERLKNRSDRIYAMVRQLSYAGFPLDAEKILSGVHGAAGRPHVAKALVEAGYANSVNSAFSKFLVPGKCGYVPKTEVAVKDAVALLHKAGGIAVLAHPMELKMGDVAFESVLQEWKSQGLDGIEVYHPSASNSQAEYLKRIAVRESMLSTGGSDFHGKEVKDIQIGEGTERWISSDEDLKRIDLQIKQYCHEKEK